MTPKAVCLFSGGLDSILALHLMLEQRVEVTCLHVVTPFAPYTANRSQSPRNIAQRLGVDIRIIPVGEDYIDLIRNPQYGYGAALNPCIDCHIFFFSMGKRLMEDLGADFIFTGEVVGERPMSQHGKALSLIDRKLNMTDGILRPLSAKLLPPTKPERLGLIDRQKLMGISGRNRAPQLELAKRFGESDFPTPAGGCLITEKEFGYKVQDAFNHEETTLDDMHLLRYGRHYRMPDGAKLVVGRDEIENRRLGGLARHGDVIIDMGGEIAGPVAVLRRGQTDDTIALSASIVAGLSKARKQALVPMVVERARQPKSRVEIEVEPAGAEELKEHRITFLQK